MSTPSLSHFWSWVSAALQLAQAATAYATITPALNPSTEQFQVLAWRDPSTVGPITSSGDAGSTTGLMSITGYFTLGGNTTTFYVDFLSAGAGRVNPGDSVTGNAYFQSRLGNPSTNNSLVPATLLAYATCTVSNTACTGSTTTGTWTSSVSLAGAAFAAAVAAKGTNPVNGNLVYPNVSGQLGNSSFALTPAWALGTNTGICASAANCTQISPTTNANSTSVLGYSYQGVSPPITWAPTVLAPGVAFIQIIESGGGDLSTGGTNSETPAFLSLNLGAVYSVGSVYEPGGNFKSNFTEQNLFWSCVTNGGTLGDCAYRATRQPWAMTFMGDPLAQPFSGAAPPATTAASTISGVTSSGVIH